MSSAKWWSFYPGINVLKQQNKIRIYEEPSFNDTELPNPLGLPGANTVDSKCIYTAQLYLVTVEQPQEQTKHIS